MIEQAASAVSTQLEYQVALPNAVVIAVFFP